MVNNNPNLKRIILIFGAKQAGKDTAGATLKDILPNAKVFAFADELKSVAHKLFGIPKEWLYGTNDDKNRETQVRWCDLPLPADEIQRLFNQLKQPSVTRDKTVMSPMTVREFLIVFGTEICRKMNPDCWVDSALNSIYNDTCETAIITDGRFPNELRGILDVEHGEGVDAVAIALTRNPFAGDHKHDSELGVAHVEKYISEHHYEIGWLDDMFVSKMGPGEKISVSPEYPVLLFGGTLWYDDIFILNNDKMSLESKNRHLYDLINFVPVRHKAARWVKRYY